MLTITPPTLEETHFFGILIPTGLQSFQQVFLISKFAESALQIEDTVQLGSKTIYFNNA